jgi:hypothetical protein
MHGSRLCIKAFQAWLSLIEAVDLKFTQFSEFSWAGMFKKPPIFMLFFMLLFKLPKVLVPLETGLVEI